MASILRVLATAAALLATTEVQAQSISAGDQIAHSWCSGCHRVDTEQQKIVSDAVPPFSSIAQMSSTTAMSLTVFLSTSHERMPNFSLTRGEIRDVSAYILSLRKPQ